MSYEVFAAHVNELVGEDRDLTNLVFVMHLGKRVYRTASYAGEYFGRFLGSAFGEEIARSGSTVSNHYSLLYTLLSNFSKH